MIVGKRRHKRIDPADAWEAIEIMIPTVRGMVYDFTKNDDAYRYDEETQEDFAVCVGLRRLMYTMNG